MCYICVFIIELQLLSLYPLFAITIQNVNTVAFCFVKGGSTVENIDDFRGRYWCHLYQKWIVITTVTKVTAFELL